MKAKLILENGMVFEGTAFGHIETCVGEVVFNTGMTGYQEVLTDPSYYGQIVTMTYPLIGNYGINLEDFESDSAKVRGFVVREKCDASSNFRSEIELEHYLKQQKIMGIEGVDTRALTRMLRNHGTMRGIITVETLDQSSINEAIAGFDNSDAVYRVSTQAIRSLDDNNASFGKRVAVWDFGVKQNILRNLQKRGVRITLYPAATKAETILKGAPDLIFLTNGPGDPADLEPIIDELKKLIGVKPVVGICLGHQLLALAMGGETEKLKFGHRGCNHPVKDLRTNRITITSQNHGYTVSKLPDDVELTHVSLNDGSVEGMRHKTLPVFSVQFHPEASPGPVESSYLFDDFIKYAE
jgi:carbamoyl-phosphate synthase small subunit